MIDRICMNCEYYEPKELECRRYPPTHTVNGYANGDIRSGSTFSHTSAFAWCGEFKLRPADVAVDRRTYSDRDPV